MWSIGQCCKATPRGRVSRSIQGKCSVRVFRVFRRSIQLGQKMTIFQKLTTIISTKMWTEKNKKNHENRKSGVFSGVIRVFRRSIQWSNQSIQSIQAEYSWIPWILEPSILEYSAEYSGGALPRHTPYCPYCRGEIQWQVEVPSDIVVLYRQRT